MVNNAGILHLGPFVDEDEASQARQVDINLHGPMNSTKLALRRMLPRGRRHIIASSARKLTPPGIATYTATKHGVVGFTEAVRWEQRGDRLLDRHARVDTDGDDRQLRTSAVFRTSAPRRSRGNRRRARVSRLGVRPADARRAPEGASIFRGAREAVLRAMVDQVTWEADRSCALRPTKNRPPPAARDPRHRPGHHGPPASSSTRAAGRWARACRSSSSTSRAPAGSSATRTRSGRSRVRSPARPSTTPRVDGGGLSGIGITNQQETVVAWEPMSGEPLRALVWQDRRTAERATSSARRAMSRSSRANRPRARPLLPRTRSNDS